jgi:hypothetical protein
MTTCGIIEKPHVWGLFKNVQMRGAQKTTPRGVYKHTLSGAFCSATQQMSVFQLPRYGIIFLRQNLTFAQRSE